MRLVVDVSVALPLGVASQATPLTERAGDLAAEFGALVPFHFHLELLNALLILERRGRLDAAAIDEVCAGLRLLDIEVDDAQASNLEDAVLPPARRYALTLYDAAYLELALRQGLPLATRDAELAAAADAAGAVLLQS